MSPTEEGDDTGRVQMEEGIPWEEYKDLEALEAVEELLLESAPDDVENK